MELTEIKTEYKFNRKRNYRLTTPCCGRTNKDGKFVNYEGLPDNYGFCHSCGKTTLPPKIYKNEKGEEVYWNTVLNRYENVNGSFVPRPVAVKNTTTEMPIKYIPDKILLDSTFVEPENNLLYFIRKTYGSDATEETIDNYYIGTDKNGYAIFWFIDINLKVRKSKVIQYNNQGKRTSNISSPYLNKDGYKTCLFGEHFLKNVDKLKDIIILVESEKTAIISSLVLPQYFWLAYGGINGLTDDKIKVLRGFRILIIPDMSANAVSIIYRKIHHMREQGFTVDIWDMTNGKTDDQLKQEGLYNQDLEDVIRNLKQ
jgi:hypothetical protein